jgi:hypothetical protein
MDQGHAGRSLHARTGRPGCQSRRLHARGVPAATTGRVPGAAARLFTLAPQHNGPTTAPSRQLNRVSLPHTLLFLGGFAIVFLSLAFLVNKAPNYTRLLVALPFVAFLVAAGVRMLAGLLGRLAGRRGSGYATATAAVVSVGALVLVVGANLSIAWDFVQAGRQQGDSIGNTGRYIESHRAAPAKMF